ILREHGVPDSLAVLAFIESAFNPEARSKAGAVGLWQITRPAAVRLLRMDRHVDERRDPLKATAAAARILKQNYEALGHWPLAITAYNHGAAGIARGVREVGSQDLTALIDRYRGKAFGFAGKNFYAEFLAALEVIPRSALYFGDQAPSAVPPPAVADQAEGALPPPVAQLGPNAPNPFNSATTIAYVLEKARLVQVDIYDAAGRRIRNLVQQVQGPGAFLVAWDGTTDAGTPVTSGIYFTRLQAGTWSAFRKLTLLR
ncbi:MAG: transglycosylase SLT domain-containing protein, partial [Candidatus Latescibacterota bacterium]